MRLFHRIDPHSGNETLLSAVARLAGLLKGVGAPRSLCELMPDAEDYAWLCSWAAALSPGLMERWTGETWSRPIAPGITTEQAVGLLVLILAAEAARREAREGSVWAPVAGKFPCKAEGSLFVQGQPTEWMKNAFEAAASRFSLRHAFALEGVQSYYVSVYLQFGFTRQGLVRLPYWLTGYQDTAALYYLQSGPLKSDGFSLLWHSLRDYRSNNISEAMLRKVLSDSAWILPEWSDEVVRRARDKPELVDSTHNADEDAGVLPFLEPPRLRWEASAPPIFESRIINIAAMDLIEPRYDLYVGGQAVGPFLRQPDGSYIHPDRVTFPCAAPTAVAVLANAQGEVFTHLPVELWPAAEEVVAFELPLGRRIDAWTDAMHTAKAYVLLLSADLSPISAPNRCVSAGAGRSRLWFLPAGWPADMQVLLEGEPLWTPFLGSGRRRPPPEPDWASSATVLCQPRRAAIGWEVSVKISALESGVSVAFIRMGARPLTYTQVGGQAVAEPVAISPDEASSQLTFLLGLSLNGERVIVSRVAFIDLVGAARLEAGSWIWQRPGASITVSGARQGVHRILPGRVFKGDRHRELAMLEGDTFVKRPDRRPGPLGALAGYGAKVTVRPGPYNSVEALLDVAGSAINPGVVSTVERCAEGQRILLDRPLAPGAASQVVFWAPGYRPAIVPPDRITTAEPQVWQVAFPDLDPDFFGIAVAYEGARLGAHWPPTLPERIARLDLAQGRFRQTAAMIRWFHLPVLAEEWLPSIQLFAMSRPVEVLKAWLLNGGLPPGLIHGRVGEEWLGVVRRIFWDWTPTDRQATAMVEAFGNGADDKLTPTVAQLLRVSPLVLGRFLRVWASGAGLDAGDAMSKTFARLAGAEGAMDSGQSRGCLQRACSAAALAMSVDTGFIQVGLQQRILAALGGAKLSPLARVNLGTALGVASCRHYLALSVLWQTVSTL